MIRTDTAAPERSGTTRNDSERSRTPPTHLEQGRPVTVLIRPRLTRKDLPAPLPLVRTSPYPVRNVLVQRADGTRVVRPWRGLAPIKETPDA